jgi:signal transduction histidine kinase
VARRLAAAEGGRKLETFLFSAVAVLATACVVLGGALLRRQRAAAVQPQPPASQAEGLLLKAIESLSAGLVLYDAEDRVVLHNNKVSALNRRAEAGHQVSRIFGERIRDLATSGLVVDAMGREEQWIAERMRTHRSGAPPILVHLTGGRFIQVAEQVLEDGALVVTQTDVTELKQREAALARQTSLLSATLEGIAEGLAAYDSELTLVAWNEQVEKVMCAPPGLFRNGTKLKDVVRYFAEHGYYGAGDPAQLAEERYAAMLSHKTSRLECTLPNGNCVEVRPRYREGFGFVITSVDITEDKQRAAALARQTALLTATRDSIAEGLTVFDTDLKLLTWNEQAIQLMEVPPGIFRVGAPISEIMRHFASHGYYGEGDVDTLVAERIAAMEAGGAPRLEMNLPDGRCLEVRPRWRQGFGLVITSVDISDRKRFELQLQIAKEQAELANRAKTNFLGTMSHELRTPLNAIIGFSEIIEDQLLGPIGTEKYLDYVRDIHMSGSHLLEVINDILDLSKVEAGKFELLEKGVDLARVVESTIRLMRDKATRAELSIVTAIPDPSPVLMADERALKQIILNLLSNSIKFTRPGGTITIAGELVANDEFAISVADTGIGMPEPDIPKALAPFGQVDSSLTRKYAGTGLGLPLVKSLAELHGGRLTLTSTVGVGTRATVYLPANRVLHFMTEQHPLLAGRSS